MIQSRVFVFLAIALSLSGCLCAEVATSAPEVANESTAREKVTELQAFTARVLANAESQFTKAKGTKSTVESQKIKADSAESDVRKAAAQITAKERKEQAEAVALKATEELGKCDMLYQTAKEKAEEASNSLKEAVASAKTLVQNAKIDIQADSSKPGDYTNVIKSAATVTDQTTTLSGQIDARTVLTEAETALLNLQAGAKKVQVLKYQAESLLIVSNIEAKMSQAKIDIQSITDKKEEIDTIVEDMNKKLKSAPEASKGFLNSLCTNAQSQLRTATSKVTEANACNEKIQGRKTQLDGTLKTLMARTDDQSNAGTDAGTVKWHATDIGGEIEKIKQALKEAETSVSSAKAVQKQMQDTMDKTSEQPVDANLDNTEQNKSTQVTQKEKQNTKEDNSELLNKDKLHKMTNNMTNNSLIGGEVPTRSAANDSAVTVFIPLLVILVMSAALH